MTPVKTPPPASVRAPSKCMVEDAGELAPAAPANAAAANVARQEIVAFPLMV
jgi:hypothetical protein